MMGKYLAPYFAAGVAAFDRVRLRLRKPTKEAEAEAALREMRAFLAPARRDLTDPNLPRIKDEAPTEKPAARPAVGAAGRAKVKGGETWATVGTYIFPPVDQTLVMPTALVTRPCVPRREIATHCTDGTNSYLGSKPPTPGYKPRRAAPEEPDATRLRARSEPSLLLRREPTLASS